jgi:hypothetical protein
MNAAHLHLIWNHIPVAGSIFASLLLILALLKHSDELKKAALWFFVLVALLAIPAYVTGGQAEKVVEHLPGVTEAIIDRHEDAAKVALILILAVGVVALSGLVTLRSRPAPQWFAVLVLTLALAAGGALAWTANLGGEIRHTEIRSDALATPAAKKETKEKHD